MQLQKACSEPAWKNLQDLDVFVPRSDTEFLLVDMHESEDSAIYLYNTSSQQDVDIIGTVENKGHTIIIRWEAGHFLKCFGPCRIGEVSAIDTGST
ncbi:hypothetical protein CSHISOI_07868 [Colletotrichum shisoi]|uniref:Uncharacterized protein n=1 Tax=Colletotrichum shisoi TaxID=2078593 RepID=A0A5Q4BKS5_9PEZI|nr:hypothetical protein CSHISOI_07868 [Colletotrichum shisoi]